MKLVEGAEEASQRQSILTSYGYNCDRLVREAERQKITTVSRSQAWKLEKEGRFPKRKRLGKTSCAWLLSDLLIWCLKR